MSQALFKLLTLTWVVFAMMVALPGCEEPTDPSLEPPDIETPTTTTAPSSGTAPSATAATTGPRTPAEYRKAAEAGDVPSMLLLGRSHESLGQAAEARKWYQRAADAGSEDGKRALAQLTAGPTTKQSPVAATTSPTVIPQAGGNGNGNGSGETNAAASTQRVAVAPLPPGDPTKLRWIDIGAVLNYADIISDGQTVPADPSLSAANGQRQVFMGRMTSRDAGIIVAAMGPSESDLTEVTAVIRVRNRVDPGTSPRVAQAGAVTARVTNGNVNQNEFVEWITRYLQTDQRSEPIFRNGWRISISGTIGEGKKDPRPQLGTAVMIEMKK